MADATNNTPSKNSFVPLIDFGPFNSHNSPAVRLQTAQEIYHAFQTSGFIYLTNHGISPAQVEHIFSISAKFFARPQAEKDALAWDSPAANRGYTGMGREKASNGMDTETVSQVRQVEGQDLKESFEIGRDDETAHPNHWPPSDAAGDEFRTDTMAFHGVCKQLHAQIMRALALGLGLDESWFDEYTAQGDNTLRLLHYPEVSRRVFRENKLQVRAGAHSDYGSITLLFQDQRGGLQVRDTTGKFIDVTPIKDTIVVNAGDLLARWSNDFIKSTIHRVVEPPLPPSHDSSSNGAEVEFEVHPPRYSIAYFCNPGFNKVIETIPGTIGEGQVAKYPPVNSGEYLVQRLTATY